MGLFEGIFPLALTRTCSIHPAGQGSKPDRSGGAESGGYDCRPERRTPASDFPNVFEVDRPATLEMVYVSDKESPARPRRRFGGSRRAHSGARQYRATRLCGGEDALRR